MAKAESGERISRAVREFLTEAGAGAGLAEANDRIEAATGLVGFFADEAERAVWVGAGGVNSPGWTANGPIRKVNGPVRKVNGPVGKVNGPIGKVNGPFGGPAPAVRDRQWGDFQTPLPLAGAICDYLRRAGCRPSVIIEPTAGGEANFIRAALAAFPEAGLVHGVEIQPGHVFTAKLRLLEAAAAHGRYRAKVALCQGDIFMYEFPESVTAGDGEVLILGNPPWVTNAELGALASRNLPVKRNQKRYAGFDALTGKSNFDISESIILRLLSLFQRRRGWLAMLCKEAVVRNLVRAMKERRLQVGEVQSFRLDARQYFGANVAASLLVLRLGVSAPELRCQVRTWADSPGGLPEVGFGPGEPLREFGWVGERFVADVSAYRRLQSLDGRSPFVWRQGIKHDCARVMELAVAGGAYANSSGEHVAVEEAALFPLLKGRDLSGFAAGPPRLVIPLTQRKIGEETDSIGVRFPQLYAYLRSHEADFRARKSAIYRHQPEFALFGVGEYSFAPYKVAISGLHKHGQFTLVSPAAGRPVMLDDTCYFLGFDRYADALFTTALLNSGMLREFLQSVIFLDAKRPYTKELLMRINVGQLALGLPFGEVARVWERLGYRPAHPVTSGEYEQFRQLLI